MEESYSYIMNHCKALLKTAEQSDPWVFVCAALMIEYLAKMTGHEKSYSSFISSYLAKVDCRYRDFKYSKANQNLPEQMYFVLRNGLIHSFTLKPNRINSGKMNSILLSHTDEHFSHRTDNNLDACVFNAYSLVNDLCTVIDNIYESALTDTDLNAKIKIFWQQNPPLGIIVA